MKFVHAADLHLDSPMRGLSRYERAPVEKMRGATRRALENLIAMCIAERASFLLIAGDLFDGDWKDYGTGLFFASQMVRLHEAGIPVVMLRGNHDAQRKMTRSLKLPPNVKELSVSAPESYRVPNTHVIVHGQGFAERVVETDLAATYPEAVEGYLNIGLLHTSLSGRPGHEPYAPTSLDVLAKKGYAYWALGHVHAFEIASTSPYVVFPGNLQGRHAKETGPKGAVLVTVEGDSITRVEHKALDDVRWLSLSVDLSSATTVEEACDLIARDVAELLKEQNDLGVAVRIVLTGTTPAHVKLNEEYERLVNEVRSACYTANGGEAWVEKVLLATQAALDLDEIRKRHDPVGDLARSIDALRNDDSLLSTRSAFIEPLWKKLPREIEKGADALHILDSEWQKRIVDRVEQTLLPHLLEKEEG